MEADGLTDDDGEMDADGLSDADGLGDGDDDGDNEAEPVVDSCSATNTPAVSPDTASVGLLVSPVLVLIRNSPRTRTAAALLRERATEIAVKLVDGVMSVVLLASLPSPRK